MARPDHSHTLALEALEDRFLPAGNVTAAFLGGVLALRGDAGDNQVMITQTAAGTLRVTGLDQTTINKQGAYTAPRPARGLDVRMRQGGSDDIAILGSVRLAGALGVRFGDGSFRLDGSAGPVRIGQELIVQGGANGDVVIRNDVRVAGRTEIGTGGAVTVAAGQAGLPNRSAARFSNSLNVNNPYFPLVPGSTYSYDVSEVDGAGHETVTERIVVEVLPQTRTIAGVETRVVRDRVYRGGRLFEDTTDWYSQDENGNVWYFGEDVTNYQYDDQGRLLGTNKGGSWLTGVNGARPGVIMEASPRVGDNYYQEYGAADQVLDQARVVARAETATVPAGTFSHLLRTEDTSAVAPDKLSNKLYAPGLGTVQEFDYDYLTGEVIETTRLVSVTVNGRPVTQVVPPGGFTGTNVSGRVTESVRFKGPANVQARGGVIVRGADFRDEARISSQADVAVVESTFADLTWLYAAQAVSARSVVAEDEVRIRSGGSAYVQASRFEDDVTIRLGAGDDALLVRDSEFQEFVADGGAGRNTFAGDDGSSFGELRLLRFTLGS